MRPIHLFDVTSQHNQWLTARQSVIAGNIANANTPGYTAADLTSFQEILDATKLDMSATEKGHLLPVSATSAAVGDTRPGATWDIVHSGNSVTMEKELMKSSDVSGAYTRNTAVMKAFHRMLTAASRSA